MTSSLTATAQNVICAQVKKKFSGAKRLGYLLFTKTAWVSCNSLKKHECWWTSAVCVKSRTKHQQSRARTRTVCETLNHLNFKLEKNKCIEEPLKKQRAMSLTSDQSSDVGRRPCVFATYDETITLSESS